MFERFSDRSRKVMAYANRAAQRLRHEYIGTEDVLMGMLEEGSGVGANLLQNLGVDLQKLRQEVANAADVGTATSTIGKLPQTAETKTVMEHAIMEARGLNHNYVGTEHLLLGLLCVRDGLAAKCLGRLNVTFERAKEELRNYLGTDTRGAAEDDPIPDELIQRFKTNPLVDHYRTLLNALRDAKEAQIKARRYGRLALFRDQEYNVRNQFRRLLQMLEDDAKGS